MKKTITLISFLLFFLAQNSQAAVTGSDTVCAGETVTYYVPYVNGASYSWNITGGTALSVLTTDSLVIQWGAAGTGTIIVAQYNPSGFHTLTVVIEPKPHPLITHVPYPGCPSDTGNGGSSGAIGQDHQAPCEKVCKLSTITYSTQLNAGSTYQWVVAGAQNVVGANTNSATVTWDSSGIGNLIVYETNQWGCTDSSEICTEKVNLPTAYFTHQSTACKFSPVLFNNLSTGATSYQWTFGDGGTSIQTNPSHPYANSGTYTITLIAMNDCHCTDTFQSVINIDSLPGPSISCPSTLCAFDTATYSTAGGTGCIYNWFAIDGTIIGPNNLTTVTVAWGAGQIGTLGLVVSGCVGVCSDTTLIYIPIVPATAVITGPTRVCPSDCEYYTLPAFSGAGYTWSLNSGACGTLNDSVCCNQVRICWPNISYPCNDTLNVAYYDSFLHCGGTGRLVIRVRPRLEIIGNAVVCANTPATFNASNGVVCYWAVSPAGPVLSPSPASSVTVNWLNTPGTYTIKAWPQNPNQACNDTAYFVVKVIASPAKPVITGDTIVCANSSANYCATGAGIINWAITGGTPVNSVGNCLTVLWGNTPPFIVQAYAQMPNSPFCSSDSATQNVYLSSNVPPNILAVTPFCANSTHNFTAVGVYAASATYQWSINLSNSGSILSPNSQTTQIQWGNNAPQTVTVSIVVNVCGLTLPKATTINLNPVPNPTVTQLGNLCAGGSSTLIATGGGTYTWNGPSGFTSISASPSIAIAGLYQVTVTDANLCTALSQRNVQYVGGPTASISTLNSLGYCIGGPSYVVTMCALGNAGYTYAWNVGGPPTQCRTFNSPGSYAVTVSDANSCTALSNFLVIHEDSCNGGSSGGCTPNGIIQFTHTSCNPISFTNTSINASPVCTWNFGDLTTSNIYSPTHTYIQAGFYLVTLTGYVYTTGTDSCMMNDTAQLEIPLAAKFDTLTGCSYDSVCFTDVSTYTAGNNITAWSWNFGDLGTSNLQNPCHLYATPGVYTVTLAISNGVCTSVYTQIITVPNQPTAAFTFGGPNCINQPVLFTDGSTFNINYWNWAFGDLGTSLNQNPFHSYNPATVYPVTLIVHDIYGCYDTLTKSITISAPTLNGNITAFPDTIVCAGTNVLLIAPSCLTCNYLWSNGSTNDSIIVTSTGIYAITITDAGGCPYVTFIRIIVNNAPPAVIQNMGNADLCLGENTSLFVTYNQKWTYSWISNDTNANGTTSSGVYVNSILLGSGVFTYQVVVTDTTTGCGDTSLLYIITVHQPPVPPIITPLTSTTICKGDTIILVASHPDPSVTLEWTTGAVTDTIYVTGNGCYGVQATDTFGCSSNTTLCVTVNPLPDLCTFYEGCFDTCAPYTIKGPAGTTWLWLNNGISTGVTTQNYTTSITGSYSVIVTNSYGCTDTTGVLNLTLYPCPDSLCADFRIDSVACDTNGHQVIYYHVSNQSQIGITQVNLEVLQPHLNVAYAPVVTFVNIPSGGISPQLKATIYNGNAGDTLCFRAHISVLDSMGEEHLCCYSDTDCIIIPYCAHDTVPVDTNCCYFHFISDSIWCEQTPIGTKYNFSLKIDVCGGQLVLQSPNPGVLNVNNPYALVPGINTILGNYIATGPNDTTLCLTFIVHNGHIYCADTTICFHIGCNQHPLPCQWDYNTTICAGNTTSFNFYGNPVGLTINWSFPGGIPSSASGPGPHNVTYPNAGVYPFTMTLSNNNGTTTCTDSIHVIALPLAVVTQVGNSLNAFPSGMYYQWFNGPPNYTVIPSATNQFYTPSVAGNYCVQVSNNYGCSDTACIDFHFVEDGIGELNTNSWSVYPNPNDGSFTLSLDLKNGNVEMKVLDMIGEVVDERMFTVKNGKQDFYISNQRFATGIYFIQLKTENGVGLKRMMVR